MNRAAYQDVNRPLWICCATYRFRSGPAHQGPRHQRCPGSSQVFSSCSLEWSDGSSVTVPWRRRRGMSQRPICMDVTTFATQKSFLRGRCSSPSHATTCANGHCIIYHLNLTIPFTTLLFAFPVPSFALPFIHVLPIVCKENPARNSSTARQC